MNVVTTAASTTSSTTLGVAARAGVHFVCAGPTAASTTVASPGCLYFTAVQGDPVGYDVESARAWSPVVAGDLDGALVNQRGENMIAVHCHNDRGLALANALDGIRAGVEIVDAAVLGLGERAGIVDLAQLLIAVQDLSGNTTTYNPAKLMELYALVSRYANLPVPVNFPITGN